MNFDKFKSKQTTQSEKITLKCDGNTVILTTKELTSIYIQQTNIWEYLQQPQIQERLKKNQICYIILFDKK